MTTHFFNYLTDNQLIKPNQKTLLAVSGGIDSIVLCHLFHQVNLPFGIAHCNFKLRESDSDKDEIFVKKLAVEFAVPFYSTSFETEKMAKSRKQSIQVVARHLRYSWLDKIRMENGFDYLATAHHLNDSVETVLYNFTKGCGIRGLHGILPKVGNIVRPLLFATKAEIENFAKKGNIKWREDVSNAADKYARNKIRHHVIPNLETLNPNFIQTAGENINRLRQTEALYHFAIKKLEADLVKKGANTLKINIKKLLDSPAPLTILFEILKPYHFNNRQVEQIIQSMENSENGKFVGKTFFAKDYCLLLDREFLILKKEPIESTNHILIFQKDRRITLPDGILKIELTKKAAPFSKNNQIAILDFDKLHFPLKLRKWQAGDYFYPFGMNGKRQKLQDFFSNHKLSKFDKEKVWILENRGEICWIVGYRLDERYKVTDSTNSFLSLEFV